MDEIAQIAFWIVVATAAGISAVFAFWRLASMVRVWRAGDAHLSSARMAIWRDPGDVAALDLGTGPGRGIAPVPPFRFVEEHVSGSQPCVTVTDARSRRWRVKWGDEVQVEALATRLAWAAGYFVEICHYVHDGRIEQASGLQRAHASIGPDGRFTSARFELDEDDVLKHFDEHSWAWNDNPFLGTPELHGLKIVMMWLSNWDAKDVRDVARGSNTAIFEYPIASSRRLGRRPREARYLVIDWGGALGRWGSVVRRGRWDVDGFAAESARFVTGADGGVVRFGYSGQRTADIADGIRVSDVAWLMARLSRLTDRQIEAAVKAAGGSTDEVAGFTRALRARLDQLAVVAGASGQESRIPQQILQG
jgi:hypothetical protein